jgi:hypothetical protein
MVVGDFDLPPMVIVEFMRSLRWPLGSADRRRVDGLIAGVYEPDAVVWLVGHGYFLRFAALALPALRTPAVCFARALLPALTRLGSLLLAMG